MKDNKKTIQEARKEIAAFKARKRARVSRMMQNERKRLTRSIWL